MAWERRRNGSYYFRKIRTDGGVRSVYVGGGVIGNLAMSLDELRRGQVNEQRQRERGEREHLHALDRQAAESERDVRRHVAVALTAAGYHQHHRGEWRRKRREQP